MDISHLDHLVLTVSDIENTVQFYQQVLGMKKTVFSDKRVALSFGMQKINLHQAGREFEPKAATPGPGSADLCFITTTSLAKAMAHVQQCGIEIIEGPPCVRIVVASFENITQGRKRVYYGNIF